MKREEYCNRPERCDNLESDRESPDDLPMEKYADAAPKLRMEPSIKIPPPRSWIRTAISVMYIGVMENRSRFLVPEVFERS